MCEQAILMGKEQYFSTKGRASVSMNESKNKCRLAAAKLATHMLRDIHGAQTALHQCRAIVKSLL